MAKFEEKDPRWIVEEREDGTNVKNWHWTEKDCFAWTQTRLAELLSDVSLTDSSKVTAKTNNICQVKGEAFINNRKNKIFASFELEIKIGYVGTMKNEEGVMVAGDGNIVVPNFSDEQDPEDWAFLVVPTKEDKNGETIKADILLNGREKLRALLETLVDELKSGVPVEKHGNTESKPNVENKPKKTKENSVSRPSVSSGGYFRELHLKERFQANPKDIFDCFTIPQKFQAFTLDAAQVIFCIHSKQSLAQVVFRWTFVKVANSNGSVDPFMANISK